MYFVNCFTGRTCRHLNKAVNFGAMKKALKQMGPLGECTVSVYMHYQSIKIELRYLDSGK